MWKDVKRLSSKFSFYTITQHKSDSSILSDLQDIPILATHFTSVLANSNHNDHFNSLKLQAKALSISVDTDDSHLPYNVPVSLPELPISIHKNLSNSAPGSMLKNIYSYFLYIILHQDIYPQASYHSPNTEIHQWPSSLSVSYRPIASTYVQGKLFQKILNKKLQYFDFSNWTAFFPLFNIPSRPLQTLIFKPEKLFSLNLNFTLLSSTSKKYFFLSGDYTYASS